MNRVPDLPVPHVPGLAAAFGSTGLAWLLLWLIFAWVAPAGGAVLGLAMGLCIGFGGVGTVLARAVPAPADLRIGLCGFAPRFLWMVFLLSPIVILSSELDNVIADWLPRPSPDQEAEAASGLRTLEWALFAALLRPVVEEFFFRGVMQQGLVGHLGRASGLAVTAVLFAAVRASFAAGSSYGVATLGAQGLLEGGVLGLVRLATGSIVPGMLLSGFGSAVGLAATVFEEAIPVPGFNADGDHTPAGVVFGAAVLVGVGLTRIVRAARRAPELPLPAAE